METQNSLGELLAESQPEVRHGREISDATLPDPAEDLTGVEPGQVASFEQRFELGQGQFGEVDGPISARLVGLGSSGRGPCAVHDLMISFAFNPFKNNQLEE